MSPLMLAIWRRVPTTVGAITLGFIVLVAGSLPWAILAGVNLKLSPGIPWAALVMAIYLWIFWRYAQGAGWPASTYAARERCCRTHALRPRAWIAALLAGALGLAALVALLRVVNRLVRLPVETAADAARLPAVSLVTAIVMSAVVAGVVEEIAFRGYLQGPIERRHGPLVAIVVCGACFGLAHFTHPQTTLALMPYYLGVASVYGMLAYLTNSVLPSMALHVLGNIAGSAELILRGRAEWQTSKMPAPLVWTSGPDASFWMASGATFVLAAAAVAAYANLVRVVRAANVRLPPERT